MSGSTYPRTGGSAILPGTWDYVRSHPDVARDALTPQERSQYDAADAATRARFDAAYARQDPPGYLAFAIEPPVLGGTPGAAGRPGYPGAVEQVFTHSDPPRLVGDFTPARAAQLLHVTEATLAANLLTFSGDVVVTALVPGTHLYRVVGLTTARLELGAVTNSLLGPFWTDEPPGRFADLAALRATTALLAEWNGDYGYVEIVLAASVPALIGTAGPQKVPAAGTLVEPGGARQLFVPNLTNAVLATPITGQPLRAVLRKIVFGRGHAPA